MRLVKSSVILTSLLTGMILAGCAQAPDEGGGKGVWRKSNTKEYFSQKSYGKASPRVVRNGRRVPKGGGRAIVGRPYKVAGKRYYPRKYKAGFTQFGRASWYGDAFHGRKTANGEIYDMSSVTAAHPTMPLPSYARVTNRKNGRSIVVRVNDRGPFHGGRVIDLSKRVADLLDFRRHGTANVKVEYIKPASTAGSDDRILLASLRTDGSPAQLDGGSSFPGRTMVAGLFGSGKEAAAAPPPRQRQRQPVQTQAVVSTSTSANSTLVGRTVSSDSNSVAASTFVAGNRVEQAIPPNLSSAPRTVPVASARPFDLATIPGAGTPIAAAYRPVGAPAANNRVNISRVSFYAPFVTGTRRMSRLRKRGPFEGIDLTRLRKLRDHH